MKYIYYIVAIVVVFSALVGYGLLSSTTVQVSKPALVINDRIISENEYQELLKEKPAYMDEEQYIDSVIVKELFIQEALKLNINKEESFRRSVEDFYEQSLVKVLLDRKFDSYNISISEQDVQKFSTLQNSRVVLTKTTLPAEKDEQEISTATINQITSDFADLSDDLKFIVFNLKESETTEPMKQNAGKEFEGSMVTYTLEKTEEITSQDTVQPIDTEQITTFLINKKKEELLDRWTSNLRNQADIWRK